MIRSFKKKSSTCQILIRELDSEHLNSLDISKMLSDEMSLLNDLLIMNCFPLRF